MAPEGTVPPSSPGAVPQPGPWGGAPAATEPAADRPAGPVDLGAPQATLAHELRARGATAGIDTDLAAGLLQRLGIPALLEDLAVAERVIRAADGFHPVARFFVDGSPEQRLILDVLRRAPG